MPRPPLVHTYSSDFFFSSLIRPQPAETGKQKTFTFGKHQIATRAGELVCATTLLSCEKCRTQRRDDGLAKHRYLLVITAEVMLEDTSSCKLVSTNVLEENKEDCNSPTAEHLFIINSLGRAHCFMCENSPYITAALKTRACLWGCVCVCVSGGGWILLILVVQWKSDDNNLTQSIRLFQ